MLSSNTNYMKYFIKKSNMYHHCPHVLLLYDKLNIVTYNTIMTIAKMSWIMALRLEGFVWGFVTLVMSNNHTKIK